MKVIIADRPWADTSPNRPYPDWYVFGAEVDLTTEMIEEAIAKGNGVLLHHYDDGAILWLDHKMFRQR